MSIIVRPVDIATESQKIVSLLQTNLPALPHACRFQWLYRDNPDGPASSWFACERDTGAIVGMTSIFPRSMWVGDQLKRCGQVGDFAIAASHRSLGPALLMQRATFEPVDRQELSFCYDCPPHDAGMAPFRRLGIEPNCVMQRYALPLRVDRQIGNRFGSASHAVAALGNATLAAYRRTRWTPKTIDVTEYTGRFEEEFTELDRTITSTDAIRGCRSAAHLNWRYRDDPLNTYRIWTARRNGELLAFAVLSMSKEHATVVDLFGKDLGNSAIALLRTAVQGCGVKYQTLESFLSDESDLMAPLLRAGFHRRSVATKVVAYAAAGSEMSAFLHQCPRWNFNGAEIRA